MNLKRIYSCCLPLFFIFWMVVTMIGFSQQKTVSGNVTDENGLPLPGATVIEQGTNNGTTTDFDGNYSITVELSSLLEVSYVGYKTEIVSTSDPDKLNVSMQLSGQLDEIVVTALGISREKKSLGYSTQTVDGDDIADVKGTNLFDALSGEVAGLDVKASGTLGGTPNTIVGRADYYANALGWARAPKALHIHDGSFVKLREISLSYSIPDAITSILSVQSASIALNGRNLWIISKNIPYSDPEAGLSAGNIQGYQSGAYPAIKEFGATLNIKF